jgi:hypothetical protein
MSFVVTPDTVSKMVEIGNRLAKKTGRTISYLKPPDFFEAFFVKDHIGDMFDLVEQIQKEIDIYNPLVLVGYESYKDLFHWHVYKDISERNGLTALHYDASGKSKPSHIVRVYKNEERKRMEKPKQKFRGKVYA